LRYIEEPSRKTPVIAETDVLVIGGGPGGLSAAVAAAREGVDTMLVERYGCFGGVITQAMIGTVAWYRTRAETVDAGGIGTEFEQRAKAMSALSWKGTS
jgi:flavin-dependent dehydrogenase